MDLIEGMEKTCDAQTYYDLLHRYRSNLHEFFKFRDSMSGKGGSRTTLTMRATHHTSRFSGLDSMFVKFGCNWTQRTLIVASEHYRPGIIEEVTAETVM
eukprot:663747-Amphidinium_carterae.1